MFPRMYETGPGEAWTTQEFTRYQAVGLDKSVEFGYADSTLLPEPLDIRPPQRTRNRKTIP